MHLVQCLHPVRVYNKSLGEFVWTSCGKCEACQMAKRNRWISRLEYERQFHLATMFVTLTYNNESLPKYSFPKVTTLRSGDDSYFGFDSPVYDVSEDRQYMFSNRCSECIAFDELFFESPADRHYFDNEINLSGGIPYASVTDLQLFNKRLNKYFHDNVTQEYKNFRYFCVSEYGSTTLRPHFHCLYFVDSQSVVDRFSEAVRSCWSDSRTKVSYGLSDTQVVQTTASSYVASYITKFFDMPSFYTHKSLRPFFVCSKRPSIGTLNINSSFVQEEINSCSPVMLVRKNRCDNNLSTVPLYKCIENRCFPKFAFYNQVSDSLKFSLFRIAERFSDSDVPNFREFLSNIKFHYYHFGEEYLRGSDIWSYLLPNLHEFTDKGVTFLKRLFYVSKRFLSNVKEFGLSVNDYLSKIDMFYSNKELNILRSFYSFQQSYADKFSSDDLIHCYDEFKYQNSDCYFPALSSLEDFNVFQSECFLDAKSKSDSHFKNDYYNRLLLQGDKHLFNLNIFYYGKKCYEVVKAISAPRSQ